MRKADWMIGTVIAGVVVGTIIVTSAMCNTGGRATHYGTAYAGNTMSCGAPYDPSDETIIAVADEQNDAAPCGERLLVCGPEACIYGTRQDTCSGCGRYDLDLSEAGIAAICGPGADTCPISWGAQR